ncbi:YkvA family protein [Neisseria weaveri]|uniref:Uncharacterized conserved protein n=1 Tax=Neisseria weaveri TaxID=28091 RepID=A0A3S4YNK9_9NEIS|nr:YkvA family protein [Neisseria weaveri]EGV37161.1 hypothetical protein l13_04730 [Neisseria weaveri ATCC 51223]EGV37222.1 hypothetical protein l11_13250 [Neisseria weaveri LMG 5135]SAY50974.1 Uncharacterized conserved protein [Neisseria weaveri]VEJ49384.1 Uncharacterized conserved protein [Neisseria weaveri]
MKTTPPEDFIPSFRRKKLDEPGFFRKIGRFAGRLGEPVIRQLYALYYLFKDPGTPKKTKAIILGALVYFLSPIDSIPDLLGPLGFSDDIAVITLVYAQMKRHMTESILEKARIATQKLLNK